MQCLYSIIQHNLTNKQTNKQTKIKFTILKEQKGQVSKKTQEKRNNVVHW
jgi:hypothetical protein